MLHDSSRRPIDPSSSPATASCGDAPRRDCGSSLTPWSIPVAMTFMAKGAIDDRDRTLAHGHRTPGA